MTIATITASPHRHTVARAAYAVLTILLVTVVVAMVAKQGGGYWQLALFGVLPDLALFYGVGSGLARGQLHPRAVWLYNGLHRFWGPVALAVFAAAGWMPPGLLIGALAWALHISLDRTVGYGLRTRDGFQRP